MSLLLVACSTNNAETSKQEVSQAPKTSGKKFKPIERTSSFTDEERELAINKKKSEYAEINVDTLLYGHGVKISVLQPEVQGEDITQDIADRLAMKMLQITSQNGISGVGISPDFVLGAKIAQTERSVTSTVPQKMVVEYEMTFVVLNAVTSDVYATATQTIMGIGDSFTQANRNAVKEIKNTHAMQEMLQTASNRIIDWYNNNEDAIKSQIKGAEAVGNYELALALAKSIPFQCANLYKFANEKIEKLSTELMRKKSKEFLGEMTSLVSSSGDEFNPEVGAYFKLIPIDAPEYTEAKKLYSTYESKCVARRDELEVKKEKEEQAAIEFEKYKLDMQHAKELEEIKSERLKGKYEAEAAVQAASLKYQSNPPTSLFGSIGYAIGGTFQRIFRGIDSKSSTINDEE